MAGKRTRQSSDRTPLPHELRVDRVGTVAVVRGFLAAELGKANLLDEMAELLRDVLATLGGDLELDQIDCSTTRPPGARSKRPEKVSRGSSSVRFSIDASGDVVREDGPPAPPRKPEPGPGSSGRRDNIDATGGGIAHLGVRRDFGHRYFIGEDGDVARVEAPRLGLRIVLTAGGKRLTHEVAAFDDRFALDTALEVLNKAAAWKRSKRYFFLVSCPDHAEDSGFVRVGNARELRQVEAAGYGIEGLPRQGFRLLRVARHNAKRAARV